MDEPRLRQLIVTPSERALSGRHHYGHYRVTDGQLVIFGPDGQVTARYAPGAWLSVLDFDQPKKPEPPNDED
jgi:hypothetical protein